jgi:hypothetical protein
MEGDDTMPSIYRALHTGECKCRLPRVVRHIHDSVFNKQRHCSSHWEKSYSQLTCGYEITETAYYFGQQTRKEKTERDDSSGVSLFLTSLILILIRIPTILTVIYWFSSVSPV